MNRKVIATIKRNDSDSERVNLYSVDGSPNAWADDSPGEDIYDTGVPIERIGSAWGDPAWDLEVVQD